jgi:deoxyribodipyrimidine photo-lyase
VAEPALWRDEPDMAARQWAFVAECLAELRESLAALGQPLVVRVGDVTAVLAAFHRHHGIAALWSHEETGNGWTYARDLRVAAWCREMGIPWHEPRQTGVIRRMKTRDGWAGKWDRFMGETMTAPPPGLVPLPGIEPGLIPSAQERVQELGQEFGQKFCMAPDPCPERRSGGRVAGQARLADFLARRGQTYRRAMSSPLAGAEACSRLSPYLAWGALSMREVAQATWARQRALKTDTAPEAKEWRQSLTSFNGRLHWHCHFMQKLEDEPRLEFENLHRGYDGLRPGAPDADRLAAWANGETGLPFVDACMRSLRATGWLNFRMRAMLMAVASYHLWLPWRASGEVLARRFTDYEPGIHWPQVQMQSGTTGVNTVRIYNPVKQGHDQDPTGAFTRRWLPELAAVPDAFLQEPWKWEGAGSGLGRRYPWPVVDHLQAAREARDKVWAIRRGGGFRDAADAIQAKHGSRRNGSRRSRKPAKQDSQMVLKL